MGTLIRRLTILLVLCLLPSAAAAHDLTYGTTVETPQGRYAQRRLLDSAPPVTSARLPLRIDLASHARPRGVLDLDDARAHHGHPRT